MNGKEGLSKCGKCKQAFYCNVDCQAAPIRSRRYLRPYPSGLDGMRELIASAAKKGIVYLWAARLSGTDVVPLSKGDWPMHKLECSAMCAFREDWSPSETKTQTERTASERLLALREFEAPTLHAWDAAPAGILSTGGRLDRAGPPFALTDLDKLDNEKKEMNQTDIAALHHFYSKHLDFPDNEALTVLFAQVNCNGFTIEDEELSHLGSAVFPDVALMNHSCNPNVIVTYKGTVAEVRAVQEIKPGEEIFTSYIDLLYPTEDRNERLTDSYFFTCECKECVTKSKDKAKMEIRKLSTPPKPEEIRDMVKYARNIIEEFRRAKHYKNILVCSEFSICELSLEKMGTIFEVTNVYMLHMMYQAMGVCLYMQDWEGAMSYGEKIIKPYSMHYPAYSLNVASMYLKLGRLYLGLGKTSLGVKALKQALAIMEVAHGKDHHYLAEIKREIEEQNFCGIQGTKME
ncbi:N-lysine methyltransferase SMYD2-like [Scleropages formosus]|uniref:[histone H3]-lysine(4) N-trimethyltransferase n=1 Tax=Scleropages formosus TaxID=113540 RepID=A0A0P7UNT5_SCLFO|nr:N-lysine methyltransferase SMYD2-like [Scleropages formosus]